MLATGWQMWQMCPMSGVVRTQSAVCQCNGPSPRPARWVRTSPTTWPDRVPATAHHDRDRVEEHNVGTQLYGESEIGAWKVEALRQRLFRATGVEIEALPKDLTDRTQ
jgi:hypothetical protein